MGGFIKTPKMKVLIPDYLLESVLRHYAALASSDVDCDNLRAVNAKRVARKEIEKVRKIIDAHKGTNKHID